MAEDPMNLISVDETITRARKAGVNFGKGNPRNRLRYYAKLGLIPPAKRKCFGEERIPKGAYPEKVVDILVEIDRKLKQGKSIQVIARELKEKEKLKSKKETTFEVLLPTPPIYIKEEKEIEDKVPEKEEKPLETEEKPAKFPLPKKRISFPKVLINTLKIFTLFLIFATIGYVFLLNLPEKDFLSKFLASLLTRRFLIVEKPTEIEKSIDQSIFPSPEPYLTINVETDINAPLNLKAKEGEFPLLSFFQGKYKGTLTVANLSGERNYILPDQSGTICLNTGNCFPPEDKNKVITPGGSINRLVKFIGSHTIGNSSIVDYYKEGLAIVIDRAGNVGIGTESPKTKLEVKGSLQLKEEENYLKFDFEDGVPSLSAPALQVKTNNNLSLFIDSEGRVGIGNSAPDYALEVQGKIQATGDICTKLGGGKCLSQLVATPIFLGGGGATVQGVQGSGAANYLALWSSSDNLTSSIIYQDSNKIGIGTASPTEKLTVSGNTLIEGALTLSTSTSPQLILNYDSQNYLKFFITAGQSLITASSTLVLNSLAGEIDLGDGVTVFDASRSEVRGDTFISSANDSTVRKSGERVFRAAVPVFPYAIAAQTESTSYVQISKEFTSSESLSNLLPSQLPGTTREFAFLIKIADDIPTNLTSDWRVYRPANATTSASFSFSGQAMTSLEKGNLVLSDFYQLPDNDWRLEVKVPSGYKIRIFAIYLLVYDKIQ
jgi:DNA-binding transcriptional MerR regulator